MKSQKQKTRLSPCPKCRKKNRTVEEKTKDGFYILTDCNKCGYWRASIRSEMNNDPVSGSWTRVQLAELDQSDNARNVLQPLDGRTGRINKNFVQVHGTKTLEKEFKMSKQEVLKQAGL